MNKRLLLSLFIFLGLASSSMQINCMHQHTGSPSKNAKKKAKNNNPPVTVLGGEKAAATFDEINAILNTLKKTMQAIETQSQELKSDFDTLSGKLTPMEQAATLQTQTLEELKAFKQRTQRIVISTGCLATALLCFKIYSTYCAQEQDDNDDNNDETPIDDSKDNAIIADGKDAQ